MRADLPTPVGPEMTTVRVPAARSPRAPLRANARPTGPPAVELANDDVRSERALDVVSWPSSIGEGVTSPETEPALDARDELPPSEMVSNGAVVCWPNDDSEPGAVGVPADDDGEPMVGRRGW